MSITPQQRPQAGWQGLFWDAFRQSRNPMVLLDDQRRIVDLNGSAITLLGYERRGLVGRPIYELRVGGPAASDHEWRMALRERHFTGVADLRCADGSRVRIEFAGHPEIVTGKQLILFVALHTRTRRVHAVFAQEVAETGTLSDRELEVVRLIARGLSGPEIADELQLAQATVRTHVQNAMTKTGSRSRAHLVAITLAGRLYWTRDGA